MHMPVPTRNGITLFLIFDIPNEQLGIIISDTQESLHTRCHISINGPAHTSYQSRHSYTVLLTQVVK
ncbi:hypothetical protein F383_16398 [Gossypium arboreum]|uniref:Uncharacterized protein n=1 Tax=Gossypium arboreum TaxID=29729 RepID=A0A0B0NJ41_GOSAR|nr:hypothetical protein F383_16398 [Gossypium arboreum]